MSLRKFGLAPECASGRRLPALIRNPVNQGSNMGGIMRIQIESSVLVSAHGSLLHHCELGPN